jgi:hypothetical protein
MQHTLTFDLEGRSTHRTSCLVRQHFPANFANAKNVSQRETWAAWDDSCVGAKGKVTEMLKARLHGGIFHGIYHGTPKNPPDFLLTWTDFWIP